MKTFRVLAAAVPAWFCAAALAQTPPEVPAAVAATATTVRPPLNYRSVFTGYQVFSDQPVAPWRATIDTVEQKGGWRAYAKEAVRPDTAPDDNHGTQP